MTEYCDFLEQKAQIGTNDGFDPIFMPDILFDFQKSLTEWAIQKGRAAIFADCGLGKTPMQLVWADNIVRYTNKNVLILAPLAVSAQTVREGEKFGIECKRSADGRIGGNITITNYQRLHYFNSNDFVGVVCDESSILKNSEGSIRHDVTEFMRKIKYRLLATATAAPNDFIELGTSSEAIGYLGFTDMLTRFFKNSQNNVAMRRLYGEAPKWHFKGQAEIPFWRWVTSWARACRYPSDLGFDNGKFVLPELIEKRHLVEPESPPEGMLLNIPAKDLREQRAEKKRTTRERCEKVAELVSNTDQPALVWCQHNDEGDLLEKIIPDAIQVHGRQSDDVKEERLLAFQDGRERVLVTKAKIGAWGMNFQHCNHVCYFPSHSYEQYYQAVRRCWRFGQKRKVQVDIVLTEGEVLIMQNLQQKAEAAKKMFSNLVTEMNHSMDLKKVNTHTKAEEIPSWL